MTIEEKFKLVLDCSFRVHKKLGPGLLESVYRECLVYELEKRGIGIEAEVIQDVVYDDIVIKKGYRIDLFVDRQIIVELKSVDHLRPIHTSQALTYMRLAKVGLGLLINFNERYLKDGIKRLVI